MRRLKTRTQFQAVLAGVVVARTAHFVLHRCQADNSNRVFDDVAAPWLGAMVPKRWARRAVTRNAIRRQIYAAAVHAGAVLGERHAHVVRLRSGFDRTRYLSASSEPLRRAVRAELEQLFQRAAVSCP